MPTITARRSQARKKTKAFGRRDARQLAALHTKWSNLEKGIMETNQTVKKRILDINTPIITRYSDEITREQLARMNKKGVSPNYHIFQEHLEKYQPILDQFKHEREGMIRIQKNTKKGIERGVSFTLRGKFRQLFMVPAARAWKDMNQHQQEKMFIHYVFNTTKFLTGTRIKEKNSAPRRMKMSEAREARIPALEEALTELRERTNRIKENSIDWVQKQRGDPGFISPYTHQEMTEIRRQIEGLRNRQSIIEGVLAKLKGSIRQPIDIMREAEYGKYRRRRKPAALAKKTPEKMAPATNPRTLPWSREVEWRIPNPREKPNEEKKTQKKKPRRKRYSPVQSRTAIVPFRDTGPISSERGTPLTPRDERQAPNRRPPPRGLTQEEMEQAEKNYAAMGGNKLAEKEQRRIRERAQREKEKQQRRLQENASKKPRWKRIGQWARVNARMALAHDISRRKRTKVAVPTRNPSSTKRRIVNRRFPRLYQLFRRKPKKE